jgi:predicted nucleotidyltransferase
VTAQDAPTGLLDTHPGGPSLYPGCLLVSILGHRAEKYYVSDVHHMFTRRDMRFHRSLDNLLASPTQLSIARVLLRSPERRWTGRELARACRVSPAQANRDLNALMGAGIVSFEVVGRAYNWRLNSDHVLTRTLSDLFAGEYSGLADLVATIGAALKGSQIVEASVFGSVARGDERDDSDIDLFVRVKSEADRRAVESRIEQLRPRIWARYGNALSTLIYTDREARTPTNPSLMENIARERIPVPVEA